MPQFFTFHQFIERIWPIIHADVYPKVKNPKQRHFGDPEYLEMKPKDVTRQHELRGDEASTGGTSGGSCWDEGGVDNHHSYTNDNKIPELEAIDKILEQFCPEITLLQFRKFEREAKIGISTRTEHEYYGNSTDYGYSRVNLDNLYMALIECGIIEG